MDKVLELLFGTWIGILSLGTVVFIIGMAIFFIVYFVRNANRNA